MLSVLSAAAGTVLVYPVSPDDAMVRIKPVGIRRREVTIKGSFV
jgi:hypothetical protein